MLTHMAGKLAEQVHDSIRDAEAAGLYYVSPTEPGFLRAKRGKGFSYHSHQNRKLTGKRHLERIAALRIPPAWNEVWICRDPHGHLQATGVDGKGRRQYLYHAMWTKLRAEAKFDRMIPFATKLHAIRRQCEKDLRRRKLAKEKVVALVVTLLDSTFIRIGNDEYARTNNSFGLTTLQDDHVTFENGGATFNFTGKSGKGHTVTFKDRKLVKLIEACRDIPGEDLFQFYDEGGTRRDIKSHHINEYLLDATGVAFTAKDFRTWAGTHLAGTYLAEVDAETVNTEAKRKRQVPKMVKHVSSRLRNTPTVCRSSYIHPRIIEDYLAGDFHDLWNQARVRAKRAKTKLNPDEKVVMCYLKG
jgi:DNA topoisomerase-1